MSDSRSAHLAMYGMVGVAMHIVAGALIVASHSVISSGWLVTLIGAWLIATGAGAVLWHRTVLIPLLASIVLSAVWMTVFFGSR